MTELFSDVKYKLKPLGLLLFFLATFLQLHGQDLTEDEELDALLDDLFFNEEQFMEELVESFQGQNFLYTNITYQDNTFFLGRETSVAQFSMIPQVSFYHRSGFNLSVSGVYFESFDPGWDVTNVTLGFYNTFGKNKIFQYDLGYSRYFYNGGSASYTNSFDAFIGVRNKNRTIGTRFSGSYLFGEDQSFQFISSSYGKLVLTKQRNFVLYFRPQLNIIVTKQTIALQQLIIQGEQSAFDFINFNVFDLLNTQLNLPLTMATRSWDFEIGYNINFPNPVAIESNLKTTGFLNISAGYLFDLGKK